jgi:hypothetical protein
MKKIIILSSMIIFSLNAQKTSLDLKSQCERTCWDKHQPCPVDKVDQINSSFCQKRSELHSSCLANCQLFFDGLNECQNSDMRFSRRVNVSHEIDIAQNKARQIGTFQCWPNFISKNLISLFPPNARFNCAKLSKYINTMKMNAQGC